MPLTGRSFGQERPPLTDLLKNILLRYPDGGQILKELIQNADDAGACEVKFLFDNSNYGSSSLISSGLTQFQGPALYCYNSAEFTEEDWDGLQRLMRSNKKDNPLKVGRFGIGFNSVYHITDLPSIVSGDTVAFLDPHEKFFKRGEPGQAFSMMEPLLVENCDQFSPFHKVFNCSIEKGNHFKGTLFRFPLRTTPSELSKKIYTKEMVMSLFESFQTESSIILHFLKNVESIGLYRRENQGCIAHIYTVQISDVCKAEVRAKRNELTKDITTDWNYSPVSVFYTLDVEEHQEGIPSQTRKWFMASQVGSKEERIIDLAKELQLLPWIGIAFPVDAKEAALHKGRIFCFLPLPPDADCRSGLPVQMNGYFGLTDNRRSLKWPGPDCQNDDTAEWNQLLLRTLGSRVYAYLIEKMTQSMTSSQMIAHANLVYSAIPRDCDVKEDWKCFLETFFVGILKKKMFYTETIGYTGWLTLGEVVLDRLNQSEETNKIVRATLIRCGQPVVKVPENILEVIDVYSRKSGWGAIREITPKLVRDVLRQSNKWCKPSMPSEEKLILLEYILLDSSYYDLQGVPLIPLENGEFGIFQNFTPSSTEASKVYITCEEHNIALLPNAHHRLLRQSITSTLKPKISQLTTFSCNNNIFPTQLFPLTKYDVLRLLWDNLPKEWTRDKSTEVVSWNPGNALHPPETWLQLVWQWIHHQFPHDLKMLEGMPLIPLSSLGKVLGKLSRHSKMIFGSFPHKTTLTPSLRQFLITCRCFVVDQVPFFVRHEQMFDYVAPPTPQGLLGVLMVTGRDTVVNQLANISDQTKSELRSWFAKLTTLSADQMSFIAALPIFRSVDGRNFLSCEFNGLKVPVAPSRFSLPSDTQIVDRKNIISSSDEESLTLLKKLHMTIENTATLLVGRLGEYLSSTVYGDQEKNKLMLWVLEHLEVLAYENTAFVDYLSRLPFVPTSSGTRKTPRQIYDHCDEVLRCLLLDNPNAFPSGDFLNALEKRKSDLGVRRRNTLTSKEVFNITTMTSSSPNNSLKKGKALLVLLNERPALLNDTVSRGFLLKDKLSDIAWIPRIVDRPSNYPSFMPWHTGSTLCKPSKMCPNSMALLVGASLPLFDEKRVKKELQDAFRVSERNNMEHVVKQLSLAIQTWKEEPNKPSGIKLANFQELLKSIYREFSTNSVEQLLSQAELSEWIWHGNGFTSPRKIAFKSSFPANIQLYPHLYLVPPDLQDLRDFLLPFGVKEEFKDEDLFIVLSSIKNTHDNKTGYVDPTLITEDLDCCRVILEWLVRDRQTLSDECRSKLLIPVQSSSGRLRLEPCDNCTYCDREFLRQGGSEFNVTDNFHLIHKHIPDSLASSLEVPRLSSCISGAQSIGYEIEEAGQHEPLTTRLRNILDEYKEGVAIFKELVQNADDAGASKVCFVVDWRDNRGERLLSPEMAKCQGPCLWAYNNAVFSEKDFENINLLAGGTKKEDFDKIGRFGLGFNAVYHLTDVPSFISARYFVAFDPNMNHIRDIVGRKSARAGFSIDLVKSRGIFSSFPDQFRPYNDLFGCNTVNPSTTAFPYKGTLFRFPLRTQEQANKSEISKRPCTRDDICHMLESLKESGPSLLLFSQNVKLVRVFEIRRDSDPISALGEPLMSLSKDVEKIVYSNSMDGKGAFLRNASNWWKGRLTNMHAQKQEGPRRTELLKVSVVIKESNITNTKTPEKYKEMWLVNSCSGQSTSLELASSTKGQNNGLLPISGAAIKLLFNKTQEDVLHCKAKIISVPGEVFCFLPLSFTSGLPVHVNGYFSVLSNRRGIWEEGVGDHETMKPFEAQWNAALMDDALARAYLQLLEVVKDHADKQYVFHSLWPNSGEITHSVAWKPFIVAFFSKIIDECLPLFYCNKTWLPLQDCRILEPSLSKVDHCLTVMSILDVKVVSIPEFFLESFRSSGKTEIIKNQTLTEERFLREHFFPSVARIPSDMRNSILCHVLQLRLNGQREYDNLFNNYPSFCCSNDGKTLRSPRDMVHPRRKAACLFSVQENRFPVEEKFLTKERAMMLGELGMIVDNLSWNQMCERAEWISSCDHEQRIQRAFLLVKHLVQSLEDLNLPDPTQTHKSRLRAAKIFPFQEKPKEYPISWKGTSVPQKALFSANELFSDRWKNLVGSNNLILDESQFGSGVLKKLKSLVGLTSKHPQLECVLEQLDEVIRHVRSTSNVDDSVKVICAAIYSHFEKVICEKKRNDKSFVARHLPSRSWILTKGKMIRPVFVAKTWNKPDGSPYLYTLPPEYIRRYPNLVSFCGVKEEFSQDDFREAIFKLRTDMEGKALSDQQLRVLTNFLEDLTKDRDACDINDSLPLPNQHRVLVDASELAINDAPWIKADGNTIKYVHKDINIHLAYKCGAQKLVDAVVAAASEPIGQPFGQHEDLTDRLKGILKSYPADEGILKELIQNADDAKASEIHFVFDPRTHSNQSVFNDKWTELCGPAICVYNNKPFSKEDIQGIQNLGIGSKADDPEKTGQYGIGFNAVYHFTDCPCFLSDDQVLCVSDPHLRYVPGANEHHPGRLFNKFDDQFRRNFQDVFSGFLAELFPLKGGTMFRFPLRSYGAFKSKISSNCFTITDIRQLLQTFRHVAKQMLLFLNNIKKISISEIKNGKLETYSVSCSVSDEQTRKSFSQKVAQFKKIPTEEIPWHIIHYILNISDSKDEKSTWLVCQSLGSKKFKIDDSPVPDGVKWGLLPRAGVAACLKNSNYNERSRAFCFLPLPVTIDLPVHVNGHFALDSSRRDLWQDPNTSDERTKWNEFVKSSVVAPTYADLIEQARKHIPGVEGSSQELFQSEHNARDGLQWYHNLFPSVDGHDKWQIVGKAFYLVLAEEAKEVLPVAQSVPKKAELFSMVQNITGAKEAPRPVAVAWYSVAEVFFKNNESDGLLKTFLDIGLPLLSHTPPKVFSGFDLHKKATKTTPALVTDFLRTESPLQYSLPAPVKNTVLVNYPIVFDLTNYCSEDDNFFSNLHNLPLLLTQDNVLRVFGSHPPVFCSEFTELLPTKQDLFLQKHLRHIFQSHLEKCLDLVKKFDLYELSNFKGSIFPRVWEDSVVHHPWATSKESEQVPTKEWIQKLWQFIDSLSLTKEAKDNLATFLDVIDTWPIIPSAQGYLVPVSMSKTVLNNSSLINSDTPVDERRRKFLCKAGCPQIQSKLLPSHITSSGLTVVLNHYLAQIQSPNDVLKLLDHTFEQTNNNLDGFTNDEIQDLLMFFQTDVKNLSKPLLQKLPLYITVDDKFISLSSYAAFYEIPNDVPLFGCEVLSQTVECVFLREKPPLRSLYEYVGIQNITPVNFYLKLVLKNYHHLSPSAKYGHLLFLRDELLQRLPPKKLEYHELVTALSELSFIYTKSGSLHRASEFYDISEEIFKAFEPKENFPPEPFNTEEWRKFLRKVGLKSVVTADLFKKYAQIVARVALEPNSTLRDKIKTMSQLLVSCLFTKNSCLRDVGFLETISKIKFVPAAKIDESLLSIHPAYEGSSKTKDLNYIKFNSSVIFKHQKLLWSSTPVLCRHATPRLDENALGKQLNIQTKPPHRAVISHIQNIAKRFEAKKEKQIPVTLRSNLSWVMNDLYEYLKECCPCVRNSNSTCSPECHTACDSLRNVPFILVDESTLVCGKQLVFGPVKKKLEPYLFTVPRNLTQYEHFLKKLGAQEKGSPLQYSSVLHTLKDCCEHNMMHPKEAGVASAAVRGLFNSLHDEKFDDSQSLATVQVLYLPTVDRKLCPSTELLVNDCMEPEDRLKEYWSKLLFDFSEKDKERAEKLVELLPDRLKLQKLSMHVENQLSLNCKDQVCVLDNDKEGCPFVSRYRQLMCSQEFSDGLVRLFKYQEQKPQIPIDVERILKTMEKRLTLGCMQSIETRLVSVTTGETMGKTTKEDCFLQNIRDRFKILIRHGCEQSSVLHEKIANFIYQITGCYIKEEKWRFVMMMLDAKEVAEIAKVLDNARIPKSVTDNWREPNPGDVIPDHFHFLLNNDLDYLLRDGELVGYDIQEEEANQEVIYVYAKIIQQTHEGEGHFKFTSRYLIDIGKSDPVEVPKSRLFKFDRQGTKVKENQNKGNEMVPYEGAQSTEAPSSEPAKPTDLEDAKKEVAEALKEIWKLPESERRSAIKRLIMRWHPDKNPNNTDLANEVTKFLFSEVERLKNGGTPGYQEPGDPQQSPSRNRNNGSRPRSDFDFNFDNFFRAYGERRRRNRERYNQWRDQTPGSRTTTEPASENEARKWLRQARVDLDIARYLFESGNETFYASTCFHCHQSAEKCLKALLFAKGKIVKKDLEEHEVMLFAYRTAQLDEQLRPLPELVRGLHDYYIKTRYPEYSRNFRNFEIPAEKYTARDGEIAITKAKDIYELIKNVLGV